MSTDSSSPSASSPSSTSSPSSSSPPAALSYSSNSPHPTQKPPSPSSLRLIAPIHPNLDLDVAPLCRVCRSDDPSLGQLFHPCRCTGSIAHVHQDCLSTWLSHSKKSSCELCGHLFSFEKVYKPGSPARPPLTIITFHAFLEVLRFFGLLSRALLVGLCWLGIVPWSVVWVSTAYWKLADWFALGITSNLDQISTSSNISSHSSLISTSQLNSTTSSNPLILDPKAFSSFNSTISAWVITVLPSLDLDPNSIALDIFQGQLITCAIILSFVVIFLLREWILQNTPPPDLIEENEERQRPHQALRPLVEQGQPIPPPRGLPIPILPLDSEDLAWSHATHFLLADTPSQHASPNPAIPTDSDQPTVTKPASSDDQITGTKPIENLETIASLHSFSTKTEQPIATPGLVELADPGLSMPYYKPYDPIDPDIFSHRVLVTSVFLLFVAQNQDSRPLAFGPPRSPHFGDPNEHQKKLIRAWTSLAELTTLHSSNGVPSSVQQLRNFVLHPNLQVGQSTSTTPYQEIEFNWTRAVLNDPKISKHIQYLFNTRPSTRMNQTRDQIRHQGLIYSLISVYILIVNQNAILQDNSRSKDGLEPTVPNNCYEQIHDVLRLFVLPLLDLPTNEDQDSNGDQRRPNELEVEIYHMIQKHDFSLNLPSNAVNDPSGISFISSLQDTIVKILVKQRILSKLMNSAAFIRYSRGMAFDDNLFTNWRLKSTRGLSPKFLHTEVERSLVANPEIDLSEITIQLINYKASTMLTSTESCSLLKSRIHKNDEAATDWIDYSTLEHKILVTSFYLLFSNEEIVAGVNVPVLSTSAFKTLLEDADDLQSHCEFSSLLAAWSKLMKICTTKPSSELFQHFKNFTLRGSGTSTEARRVHSFQKLETEWLSKLLKDPSIAQLLVSILTTTKNKSRHKFHSHSPRSINDGDQTHNFFLLKLVYVYIVLETSIPSEFSETMMATTRRHRDSRAMLYENGLNILEEHLNRLEASSTQESEEGHDHNRTQSKNQVLEMIRETRFLLDACRPSTLSVVKFTARSSKPYLNPTTNHQFDGDLRSELYVGRRLKRGIIGILARQKVLNKIVVDKQFSKYAQTMLSEADLFSRIPSLSLDLQQLQEDQEEDQTLKQENRKIDCTQETQAQSLADSQTLDRSSYINTSFDRNDLMRPRLQKQAEFRTVDSVSEPDSSVSNALVSSQQPVSNRHSTINLPHERDNSSVVAPNLENNQPGVGVAEQPVAGHLHQFAPQRAQADAVLAAGIGAGIADVFAFDDPVANGGDDELMVEDIDGILELIGMKGSLFMLAQNVGLMTMLLSLSLLAFVHLPHMMGKIAILVKAHRLLAPPFKGLLILQRYVHLMLDWLSDYVKGRLENYELLARFERVLSLNGQSGPSISRFSQWLDRWPVAELLRTTRYFAHQTKSIISKFLPLNAIYMKLGHQVSDRMNSIAYGSKPLDRALAVLIGYFELILMSLIYLSSGLDQQRAKFVSETLVNGLQQQLLIGKVAIFIFVELVIFPFLCGLLLNFTTIPIFANATLSNRLELYSSSPYSAASITWLVGTCFMFTFAVLVGTCRESLRAGVCWWIRDPSDDRFNPIREILDRSAWSQVKKISVSAVMYGAVIVCGLGSIVFNLVFFTGVLPLRIHADRPIFSSALDLVIYQAFLPLFLECFKPKTRLKECLQEISRFMARQLRLTCFLYGERHATEETTLEVVLYGPDGKILPIKRRTKFSPLAFFNSFRLGSKLKVDENTEKDGSSNGFAMGTLSQRRIWAGGSFARVPATDSVKVVQGRKMHIPVYVDGTPIHPADMAIIEQQRAEAQEEGGGAGTDQYTIVYLPPQFQARMILYVIFMWSAAVTVVWQMIGIPLLIGRTLLDRFFLSEQDEPHDVYAYAIGTLSCAVIFLVGRKVWQKYVNYHHRNLANRPGKFVLLEMGGDETRVQANNDEIDRQRKKTNKRQSIFENMKWMVRKLFHLLVLALGLAFLPILTSKLVDLYFLGLFKPKQTESGGSLPEIFLLEAWNYGAICLSIGARAIKLSLPEHPISIAQDQVMAHWRAGDLDRAVEDINLKLIIPTFHKFLLMLLIPFAVVQPLVMLIFTRHDCFGFGADGREEGRNLIEWIFKYLKVISNWSTSRNGLSNNNLNLTDQPNIQNPGDLNYASINSTSAAETKPHDHEMRLLELNYLILKMIYPLILSWFSQFYLLKMTFKIFSGWLEKLRDERFLERRRLKNYEPDPSSRKSLHIGTDQT